MSADYSPTPLARKLGLKGGHRLELIGAPSGWNVDGLPDGVIVSCRRSSRVDVLVAFFRELSRLERDVVGLATAIAPNGSLWLAWPRRAAGRTSDITEHELRRVALPLGLVDVKVAALDDDWSGLKFVWRKELR
jgi:hypothetical protein